MFKKFLVFSVFSVIWCATYEVNLEQSNIHWIGGKITGEDHYGNIGIKKGTVDINEGFITNSEIVIDMNTINVTDMNESGNRSLRSHLMNSDFFNIDLFPTSTLVIDSASEFSNNELSLIEGKIRIKDKEISMQIPMLIVLNNETAIAVGQLEIDRTLFGIVYGSGSYFSDLADRAINDNFIIKFSIIANKVSDD